MNVTTHRPCPVCEACTAELWHTIDYPADPGRILPVQYRIVCCNACGMVYDDFKADEAIFSRYYRESGKYLMTGTGGAGGATAADEARWTALIRRITPYLQNPSCSIVDLGCGKGGLLNRLWQNGFRNLTGVDASSGCIDFIRQHYGFPSVCADVTTFQTAQKFDLVLSSQVLEHLLDCRQYLRAVRELLAENSVLYLEMPDAANYLSHNKAPFYFFDQEHVNHFEFVSVTNLLHECGFEVIDEQSFDAEPVPGFTTPNLYVTVRKTDQIFAIEKNDASAVLRYVDESRRYDQNLQHLSHLTGTGYLWGVGAFCERLLEAGSFDGLMLAGLIDLDPRKQGKVIRGLAVFPPEVLNNGHADFVVITSVLYEQAIRRQLHELGFTGEVAVL